MFKVLFITYYFPPMGLSGVQRSLKFAKYMPDYEWQPTIVTAAETAYYAHDTSLMKDVEGRDVRIIRIAGREINARIKKKTIKMPREWLRKMLSFISSFLFIPDNKKSWSKKAYKHLKKMLKEESFDMIFVTGPPFSSAPVAAKLSKKFDIPYIVDYRDLWYGYQFAKYPTPLHRSLIKNMERRVLKRATKVTVTNRRVKEKLMDYYKFKKHTEIVIISHGYDPDDIEEAERTAVKTTDKMVVSYTGLFYEFITPKYFFDAFKKLMIERPDIAADMELHFIGFLRDENRDYARKLGLQNHIKEFGYLEHPESLRKACESDLLWFMVGQGRNADTISSGKLYEYIGTKKPVLACLPKGSLKKAAYEYKASFICDPYDTEMIKKHLIDSYEKYKTEQLPKPDMDVVKKYSRVLITRRLVKEFQFILGAGE